MDYPIAKGQNMAVLLFLVHRFRGDFRVFFADDNPQLLMFEQMQDEFNKSDNILIGIAPADGQIFNTTNLTLVKQITDAAWQTPYSPRWSRLPWLRRSRVLMLPLIDACRVSASCSASAFERACGDW